MNYENVIPSVSPAFNAGCAAACTVLTCSCTGAGVYWSSSSYAAAPANAWAVDFGGGAVGAWSRAARAPPSSSAPCGAACDRSFGPLNHLIT